MANSFHRNARAAKKPTVRKGKSKKNMLIKAVVMAFLLYVLLSVIAGISNNMTTATALKGSVEEEISASGYIFRNQTVIKAPVSGYLECFTEEGERVNGSQDIGYIYVGEYESKDIDKIRELNEKIVRLEKNIADLGSYAKNTVMAEQRISSTVRELSDKRQKYDMSITAEYKEELDSYSSRKYSMENQKETNPEEELNKLKSELHQLENTTNGEKVAIHSTGEGVFSSKIDGLEDKLTFEVIEGVTPSYLSGLKENDTQRGETVAENEAFCKIVDNYEWYFVATVDSSLAENFVVGNNIKIRFYNLSDNEIVGTIKKVSKEENGKVAVAIYTNRYVEGIYSESYVDAEFIMVSQEGIKLPVESLRVKDGQPGVYVLRLDVARFVPINVKYKNDKWAIVSPVTDLNLEYKLQMYDEVIVEAKNLEDGKVVR